MNRSAALFHPRYWPIWIGLALLRAFEPLPYRFLIRIGRALGAVLFALPLPFKHTARRNLELCFPLLTLDERERILREHFASLGIGILETGMTWWSSDARIRELTQVQGMEHLELGCAAGRGVIMLSAHFTTLEIGARALGARLPISIMYRPTKNPVLERFLAGRRGFHAKRAIKRDDVRTLVSALKNNEVVWYAPDQSYRKKGAQMVPFFGIPAATNTATSRLARMTGATVLPFFQERLANGRGYLVRILPALENFPSDDSVADALRCNHLIEAHIERVPAQYLWIHRRFKGLDKEYPDYYKKRS